MSLGVVVPCFNEGARWDTAYWTSILQEVPARFLFVDDGSVDETRVKIEAVIAGTESGCISLDSNRGKAEAVRLGFLELLKDESIHVVGYLDADGAFAIADIARFQKLFEQLEDSRSFDALWSSRVALAGRDIRRSDLRHYTGRFVATVVSIGYGSIPYDTQSGFKLFQVTETLRECFVQSFKTRWLFEIELLARWRSICGHPMKIWEEPVNFWHDVPGSKIRGRELMRIARDLAWVKREQRRLHGA